MSNDLPEPIHFEELDEELAAIERYYVRLRDQVEKTGQHNPKDGTGVSVPLDFLDAFRFQGEPLSMRQKILVCEYLATLNQKESLRRAGYSKTAQRGASRVFQQPKIRAALKLSFKYRMERMCLSQDRVIAELASIAFSSIGDVVDWNGNTVSITDKAEIPVDKQAAIQEITETRNNQGTSTKVRMHDKIAALNLLGKHMGMFNDKLEIDHKVSISDELEQARRRAKRDDQLRTHTGSARAKAIKQDTSDEWLNNSESLEAEYSEVKVRDDSTTD